MIPLLIIAAIAAGAFVFSQKVGVAAGATSGDDFLDEVISDPENQDPGVLRLAARVAEENGLPQTSETLLFQAQVLEYTVIQELEAEVKKKVEEYIKSGADYSEKAVRAYIVLQFGPAAGPVVDKVFESEWWNDAKGWAAEKAGEIIEGAGDIAEDVWDEVSGWNPIGGVPQMMSSEAMSSEAMRSDLRFPGVNDPDFRTFVGAQSKGLPDLIQSTQGKLGGLIGQTVIVDGEPHVCTLSGLTGLVSRAGNRGAQQWLANEADRKNYPATTRAFLDTNGIF